jgi:phasin
MADANQGTGRSGFQVPEEMRNMAERSLTQAREALENFWRASRQSAETVEKTGDRVQAGTRDMARRAFSSAEQNIRTTLDYAARLVRARDLQEAARIQAEFVRSQAEAMQTQMREFGSAVQSGMSRAAPQTVSEADQAASPKTTRGRREEA